MTFIRLALVPLILLACLTAGRGAGPSPNDEARFLAGLPVRDTPLEKLSLSGAWTDHAVELDRAWAELEKHQLQPIAAWAPANLGHFYTDTTPVLYFFSGPDFLYAHAYFPNASTYILCGIEPIGPLPQVENLPPETIDPSLANIRTSLDSLLDFSFFITRKMKVDLQDSRLSGTLPLLYIFLARAGCVIRDVTFTGLDSKGQVTTGRSLAPGVKIVFSGPGGTDQTLYYFCTDLSDDTAEHSGFQPWCASFGPAHGFLKAASYLMFTAGFDGTRNFLLKDCDAILQDDSGIPMRFFPLEDWTTHLFGHYSGPIATFKQFPQPELDQLMAVQKPAPLPFSVGYRWHPGESSLILAVKAEHDGARAPR
ncbi:MAG TPA: hypothetical protein VHY22_09910 [Chthoniobacteraceae bacterium]|jgi:hypothetical protein|nr:hypothetical protein [Chthoniobacteraceae bacterium]